MRDYLNGILSFIGAESLTDEEFDSIELETTDDQIANYVALLGVLEPRDLISGMTTRLQYYFLAKGYPISTNQETTPVSNIFVGASLE